MELNDPRLFSPQCGSLVPVKTVHQNPWFVVRNRGGYFTTEYKQPQVIILPVIDDQAVLMVRVKRPVIADSPMELPAGEVKKDESPLAAAARELAEETGIEIEDTGRFFARVPVSGSPNRCPKLLHIYEINISQAEYDSRKPHDDEIAGVECFCFEELKRLIIKGEIYISVPLAVIGRFLLERCLD